MAGEFRNASSFLCLEQPFFGDASAVFFLMVDFEFVLSSLGNRGYRAAQFEAGVIAGKIYLSAYAQKKARLVQPSTMITSQSSSRLMQQVKPP